jgi:hypothetical protein
VSTAVDACDTDGGPKSKLREWRLRDAKRAIGGSTL